MDDLKGLHDCLLNLMIEIDDICKKNNINLTWKLLNYIIGLDNLREN